LENFSSLENARLERMASSKIRAGAIRIGMSGKITGILAAATGTNVIDYGLPLCI
jgi:hypothetical protein